MTKPTQGIAQTAPSAAPASFARCFWRTTLVAVATAGALAGCSSTASSSGAGRSSDPASQQQPQGASGVSVFGDIDVNVTRERTR